MFETAFYGTIDVAELSHYGTPIIYIITIYQSRADVGADVALVFRTSLSSGCSGAVPDLVYVYADPEMALEEKMVEVKFTNQCPSRYARVVATSLRAA